MCLQLLANDQCQSELQRLFNLLNSKKTSPALKKIEKEFQGSSQFTKFILV